MEINLNRNKAIQVGDIVKYKEDLHFVMYDESLNYGYIAVSLKSFKTKECWESLHDLSLECELVEKNSNLKLSTIK